MLDHHGPQALGGRADRGGQPGRARADHRHVEDLPGRDRRHEAEGVGDLEVGGVDQRRPLGREPEHDHRQFRGLQAEFVQHLPAVPGGGVVKAGRDPVAGKKVTQLLRPRRPSLADHLHRLEAAAALAAHSRRNSVIERWNSSAGACAGYGHPVVDLAHGDRFEDRPHRWPVTPANRGHPKRRRVDGADRGQHLDAIRVVRTDPADDQRHRQASGPQVPHPGCQLRGPAAGHDLIVRAIPFGQLPMQDLPGARFTADDDDGRLGPGRFTAHGGSQAPHPQRWQRQLMQSCRPQWLAGPDERPSGRCVTRLPGGRVPAVNCHAAGRPGRSPHVPAHRRLTGSAGRPGRRGEPGGRLGLATVGFGRLRPAGCGAAG